MTKTREPKPKENVTLSRSRDIRNWIRKVEERIASPDMSERSQGALTREPLERIGKTQCDEAVRFLDGLLNAYLDEVGHEPFDTDERPWKFRNVDFFLLLQAFVWQQDERLIPALRRAREFYAVPGAKPEEGESVEAVVCQIAIGRIRKKHTDGYLPMEALDLSMPSAAIMASFRGKEHDAETDFKEAAVIPTRSTAILGLVSSGRERATMPAADWRHGPCSPRNRGTCQPISRPISRRELLDAAALTEVWPSATRSR